MKDTKDIKDIKFSIMRNEKKNSLYICLKKNNNILEIQKDDILNLSDKKDSYEYLGMVFNAIGTLNKEKLITIIYDMRIPFAFILLILKIKASTGSKFQILMRDKDTYNFIQEFLEADPEETKEFFYKTSDNLLKDNKFANIEKEEINSDDSTCEIGLKDKFKKLKEELDKDQEILMRNELLKDTDDSDLKENLRSKNEEIQRQLDTIKNISNDDFIDLMENNFTDELRKLKISLF